MIYIYVSPCFRNVPPLPGLTPNGRRVVMMRGIDLEHIAATVADGMKVVLMIGDIRLKEENVGVAGDVYILDASVATPQNFANHFAKFTPSLIKKFLICVQVQTIYMICNNYNIIICLNQMLNISTDLACRETRLVKYLHIIIVFCRIRWEEKTIIYLEMK